MTKTFARRIETSRYMIVATTLVCFVTVFIFGGCKLPSSPSVVNKWYDTLSTSTSYKSGLVELRTDDHNVANITSENFACTFQIQVSVDGHTITNPYIISYFEDAERVIISGYDPENSFTPFTICRTPGELLQSSNENAEVSTAVRIIGTLLIIIPIVVYAIELAWHSYNFVNSVSKMYKEVARDLVGVYDGKQLLQTTVRDFVTNILTNEIKAGSEVVNVVLDLVTYGSSTGVIAATQVTTDFLIDTNKFLATKVAGPWFVETLGKMAIEAYWDETIDIDTKIWVVMNYEASDNVFKKVFCSYTLYLEDPRPMAPPIPTGASANWNASNSAVRIAWDSMPNVDGYIVYRQSSERYFEYLANATNTNYDDHDVTKDSSVAYKLRSYRNNVGWSGYSNPITVNWDAAIYESSFASDPGWATSDSSRLYWDAGQQAYFMNRININGGGNYAIEDVGVDMAGRSFQLEWDIKMVSVDYASGLWFGLFDTDMKSNGENGSYVFVVFANEDRGHTVVMSAMGSDNVGQGDGSPGTSEQKWLPDTWYHVALSYDSPTGQLNAQVTNRDTGATLRSLTTTTGAFASDMDRVGASDIRQGSYQVPGAQAQGYIDNVELVLP
jgi:hypothetical protein